MDKYFWDLKFNRIKLIKDNEMDEIYIFIYILDFTQNPP
jgi:hypothetical protein